MPPIEPPNLSPEALAALLLQVYRSGLTIQRFVLQNCAPGLPMPQAEELIEALEKAQAAANGA